MYILISWLFCHRSSCIKHSHAYCLWWIICLDFILRVLNLFTWSWILVLNLVYLVEWLSFCVAKWLWLVWTPNVIPVLEAKAMLHSSQSTYRIEEADKLFMLARPSRLGNAPSSKLQWYNLCSACMELVLILSHNFSVSQNFSNSHLLLLLHPWGFTSSWFTSPSFSCECDHCSQ